MTAAMANMIIYVPESILRIAIQDRTRPPSREEALDFLRKAVLLEEVTPQGFLQKNAAYKMIDQPSMMHALTTFYGRHASSQNAMERTSVVGEVLRELEHAERVKPRKQKSSIDK